MALSTTSPHPHVITALCPVPCLEGIIRRAAVNALVGELKSREHPYGTIARVVERHHAGSMVGIRGIGLQARYQIEQALREAGLIS